MRCEVRAPPASQTATRVAGDHVSPTWRFKVLLRAPDKRENIQRGIAIWVYRKDCVDERFIRASNAWEQPWDGGRAGRAAFIRGVATVGAGLAVGSAADAGRAYGSGSARAGCGDSLQALIGTALVAEQFATTFYYTALTTGELMADSQLGGSSTDPNHPGLPPNGNSGKVRFLQAALDAELKHANSLTKAGAHSTISRFFFPAGTFSPTCATGQICTLGTSDDPNTFLGVLDTLETAFVGAYLVAVREFVTRGYPQLVEVAANIVGVESEHRALGRVIADAEPSNNLTLERMPFACIGDAATALHPFLTGKRFSHGATAATLLLGAAQVARVIGNQRTRILGGY